MNKSRYKKTMNNIYKLKGRIMNYSWGGHEFLPHLLGFEPEGHQTYAEYWMGAHKNAPSKLICENETGEDLDKLIETNPQTVLGEAVAYKYHALPYLLKILDVKSMLSIQVHPDKQQAEAGFARENQKGVPADSPHRNYKDDNHKPELMVALGDFWLLHGFLEEDKLRNRLKNIPEFGRFLPIFNHEGYKGLYQTVMELPIEAVDKILTPLLNRILPLYKNGELSKSSPDYWAAKAAANDHTPHVDRGIFSIYFFNLLQLNKNEGIFQAAGIPHAYLEGQNIELMANSDNVLRGGLTPKHVDVQELLNLVQFHGVTPQIIKPSHRYGETIYATPADDFELSKIELKENDTYLHQAFSLEIILIIQGEVAIGSQNFKRGEAAAIFAKEDYHITSLSGDSILFKATIPDKK